MYTRNTNIPIHCRTKDAENNISYKAIAICIYSYISLSIAAKRLLYICVCICFDIPQSASSLPSPHSSTSLQRTVCRRQRPFSQRKAWSSQKCAKTKPIMRIVKTLTTKIKRQYLTYSFLVMRHKTPT